MPAWTLLAATTADDVFKSMGTSAGGTDLQPGPVLAVIAAGIGLVVLLSMLKKRGDAPRKSEAAGNPSRLLRDVAREIGLRKKDLKELKTLAQLQGVDSPLTLLLCPSLMQAAINKRDSGKPSVVR